MDHTAWVVITVSNSCMHNFHAGYCQMSWACFNSPMKPLQVAQQPIRFYLYLASSSCKSMQMYHCYTEQRRHARLNTLSQKKGGGKMYYFHLTGALCPRLPLTSSYRFVLGVSLRCKHIQHQQLKPHTSFMNPAVWGRCSTSTAINSREWQISLCHIHDRQQRVRGQTREWGGDKQSVLCNNAFKSTIHSAFG